MNLTVRGLENFDTGYVAVDLHRFYGIDVTSRLLKKHTWHWLCARAWTLLDLDGLTRKELNRADR